MATGHIYSYHNPVDPLCETDGNEAYYTCSVCGKYFDVDYQETTLASLTLTALGHSYDNGVCTVCGQEDPYATFSITRVVDESYVHTGYTVSGAVYTITAADTYYLLGELSDGQIVIDVGEDEEVTLKLEGVVISCSTGPCITVTSAEEVKISATSGSENDLYDTRTSTSDASGGCIYAPCDLQIQGNGSLTVSSTYNNGIHCTKDLKIKNVTLTVTAENNGIKGNNSVTVESGTTTVYATDDGVNAGGSTSSTPYILVTGGTLDVTVGTGDVDGIDSNGTFTQTGGFVITRNGTSDTSGNMAALDTDDTVTTSGGTIVAVGTFSNESLPSTSSGNYYVVFGSSSSIGGGMNGPGGRPGGSSGSFGSSYTFYSGTYTVYCTTTGTSLFTFTLDGTYKNMLISSEYFAAGKSYRISNSSGTTTYSWTQGTSSRKTSYSG